jgi:hypothetical protein
LIAFSGGAGMEFLIARHVVSSSRKDMQPAAEIAQLPVRIRAVAFGPWNAMTHRPGNAITRL